MYPAFLSVAELQKKQRVFHYAPRMYQRAKEAAETGQVCNWARCSSTPVAATPWRANRPLTVPVCGAPWEKFKAF